VIHRASAHFIKDLPVNDGDVEEDHEPIYESNKKRDDTRLSA